MPPRVDQFAVVTARSSLGTWSFTTSRVEGTKFLILQTLPHTSARQENLSAVSSRCHLLISIQTLYISTIVLHTNSYIGGLHRN